MTYTPTFPRRLATMAMYVAVPAVLGCAVQIFYLGESAFPFGLPEEAKKDISPLAQPSIVRLDGSVSSLPHWQ